MLQLAEMARLGVQPDNIAATALLDACARNRKMEMASSVFEELFGALTPLPTPKTHDRGHSYTNSQVSSKCRVQIKVMGNRLGALSPSRMI